MKDLVARLRIEAETKGEGDIVGLIAEVDRLAASGGEAAPHFARLGDELRAIESQQGLIDQFGALKREISNLDRDLGTAAEQVDRLASAQSAAAQAASAAAQAQGDASSKILEARSHHEALRTAVKEAAEELKSLRAASKESGDQTGEYSARIAETKGQLAVLRGEAKSAASTVSELGKAHRESIAATREAETAERAATGQYQAAVKAASQLSGALGNKSRALDATRSQLAAAGISTGQLTDAQKSLAASLDQAEQELRKLQSAAGGSATGLKQVSTGAVGAKSDVDALGASADALKTRLSGVAAAVAGVFAVGKLKGYAIAAVDAADAYGQMADRIGMATASAEEYDLVQRRLLETANLTYRPLAEAQELYIRTADALRTLSYTTQESLDITDSFSYLLTTNAASADRARSAVDAYSKSIQTGTVASEQWQSILAAMPTVVEAIATATGRSTAEIREMGVTGKLALSDLNEGLRQTVELNKAATEGMGTTVRDAITRLSNTWSVYIGEANRASETTARIAELLDMVTDNLDTLVGAAMKAGEVLLAVFATKAVFALRAFMVSALGATRAVDAVAAATVRQGVAASAAAPRIGAAAAATAAHGNAATGAAGAITAYAGRVVALSRVLSLLKFTGVGLGISVALELGAALLFAKDRAEDLGEAVDGALDTPADEISPKLRAVSENAEVARFKLSELQQQFDELRAKGLDAAAALAEVTKAADIGSTDGISALLSDFEILRAGAQVTGEQIQTSLTDRLNKLTSQDLQAFGTQAEMAFNRGAISAGQLANALDAQAAAALTRLGLNADAVLTGVSQKFAQAAGAVDIVVTQYDRLAAAGIDTGAVLQNALGSALNAASNPRELEMLAEVIKRAGENGQLSGDQVATMLDAIRTKTDQVTPGINSVAEALKALGVTSDASLQQTADKFEAAYRSVVKLGGSVREQRAAFTAYAQAAVVANNGVASSTLKSQAAAHGLKVEARETGQVIVSAMTAAAAATGAVGDGADTSADGVRRLREEIERLNGVQGGVNPPPGTPPGTPPEDKRKTYDSPFQQLYARAESVGGLEFRRELEDMYQEMARSNPRTGTAAGGRDAIARMFALMRETVDSRQIESERGTNLPAGPDGTPTTNLGVITVNIGNRRRAIETTPSGARQIESLLRELEASAERAL